MKTSNLFALLITALLLFSCGGDGDDDISTTISGNSLSANISGAVSVSFEASGAIQGQNLVQAVTSGGALAIVASSTTGTAMTISIPEYTGAGDYSIDIENGLTNLASFTSVNTATFESKAFAAITGNISITEADNGIRGTFEFEGESGSEDGASNEMITVSNGSFEVILE